MSLKIVNWNVNGLRAVVQKGFVEWLYEMNPDILCLQETKLQEHQIPEELHHLSGYRVFWNSAQRKGYSGVATFVKKAPGTVQPLGISEFDDEGRFQALTYPQFTLINTYFPNSQDERARLAYKLRFCKAVHAYCDNLVAKGLNVVLCGDYNVAHRAIDLKRPEDNENSPGYYIEEREWMESYLGNGYIDVFRHFHPDQPDHYTWWSYRTRARERNIGWRIDYICVNKAFLPHVKNPLIHADVLGSDHCPVSVQVSL